MALGVHATLNGLNEQLERAFKRGESVYEDPLDFWADPLGIAINDAISRVAEVRQHVRDENEAEFQRAMIRLTRRLDEITFLFEDFNEKFSDGEDEETE